MFDKEHLSAPLVLHHSALYLKAPERRLTLILLGNSGGLSKRWQTTVGVTVRF